MEGERTTVNDLLEQARAKIRRLTPQQAAAAQAHGAIVIDTRDSADQTREGVIPGSILVTRNTLEWRADPAAELPDPRLSDFGRDLIVVCNDGYSSSLAAESLRRIGHQTVADVIGGFRAWQAEGLPVTIHQDR